ncbi:MAG: MFS transporter, partial [Candidatus Bathyarchaeia archaeon]
MKGVISPEWQRLGERSALSDIMSLYVPSFFIFLGMSLVSPILPIYARSYDVSYALASLAISMYAIGRFIADI